MTVYYKEMSGLIVNPCLYSTITVCLMDKDVPGVVEECLYNEAAQYCSDIALAISNFQTSQYPTNDFMQYFALPADKYMEREIRRKIQSACLTTEAYGKQLYAKLELQMSEDLTTEELKEFVAQIAYQYRDGWGAEFELQNIRTKASDTVCLVLFPQDPSFYVGSVFSKMLVSKECCREMDEIYVGIEPYHYTDSAAYAEETALT